MKRRRKRKTISLRPFRLLAALFAAVLAVRGFWAGLTLLGQAGADVAMISAALVLTDGSAPLLRERFRAEIYNPEGDYATGEREQGTPLPSPPLPVEDNADTDEPSDDPSPTTPGGVAPRIPKDYAAPLLSEDFSSSEGGAVLRYGAGLIRNETTRSHEQVAEVLESPWPVRFEQVDEPQVLIVHTHATESFESYDSAQYDTRNTWRSTDNRRNMVAVGDALTQTLEENGIAVIHDTTQHDYPSYNGSYERSAETIRAYLNEYPSIKVVLDLHRDAMQRDDAIVKPVAMIDGEKAAQVMIIAACDDDGEDVPLWKENFRFASLLQNRVESLAPGLMRPVYLCYRKYNMDLTTGSLLLEFGSNANTLEEAIHSANYIGQALADLIYDQMDETEVPEAALEEEEEDVEVE